MALQQQILDPGWGWNEQFLFSQGVRVGDFIFVAGQAPVNARFELVGAGDLGAQTRQVLDNIKAILALSGATMGDIVDMVVYFADGGGTGDYLAAMAEYFTGNYPTSTGVGVASFGIPGQQIEIKVVAVARQGTAPAATPAG